MYVPTLTILSIKGSPLTKDARALLDQHGVVTILEESPLLVIQAPPDVGPNEIFYLHPGRIFGARMLIRMIEKGTTLINYPHNGIRIRIWKNIVYLCKYESFSGNRLFAKMTRDNFLESFRNRIGQNMVIRINSILNYPVDPEVDRFIESPHSVSETEAIALMNWDGNSPSETAPFEAIGVVPQPPLYVHKAGLFSPKLFHTLVDKGFTHFSDRDECFVRIHGDTTQIFMGKGRGRYESLDTQMFLRDFSDFDGRTFSTRVGQILRNRNPIETSRWQAFELMKWNEILGKEG